jgi:luciferase family oxidoreductase group 1
MPNSGGPRFSILDLAAVRQDGTIAETFRNTLDVAQHAERWGFTRFWLAEHHNMPGIASAATSVLIGHVAAGTSTLRVGSGGVMLPNHASLVIAEHFGTLGTLYPDRIDLGVGRAPGSDGAGSRALRYNTAEEDFPKQVSELLAYLAPAVPWSEANRLPWRRHEYSGLAARIVDIQRSTRGGSWIALRVCEPLRSSPVDGGD